MATPQPLSNTSYSRQNLVNQAPLYPVNVSAGGYDERVIDANMSFSLSQGSQGGGGGMMMQQPGGSFRPYEAQNGHGHAMGHQRRNSAPQIYSAVYSNVDVYEMEVNGVAVMRRRKDSWLNATQILKVAGIEKGKRTKVLEKEILIGEHEKVQGGYGKYQGTWITFDRGLEFCRQYGVEELLRPLLTYDMGHDGNVPGRGGGVDTPTKEQAMAAQRKKLYNSSVENRGMGQTGTFFKNISSTASHAVAAISKARYDSPVPRMRQGNMSNSRPASFSRQSSSQHIMGSQESAYPGGSQQSVASYASDNYHNALPDSAYSTQLENRNDDFDEPPRKRVRQSFDMGPNGDYHDMSMREPSPTVANESFMYQNQHIGDEMVPLPPLPAPESDYGQSKIQLLLSLFQNANREDFSTHEVFTQLKPEDLDLPIDNSANNAIVWAATLARIPLLKQLIAKGASMFRVNKTGETALMRSCVVTNNLDHSSFPDLLEVLAPTLDVRDARGRTVLHHIAITSAVKGRSQASKYYLESLLEFVVRQGPNNRQSFGHFISEIINIQDRSGDTALNIASRIGNRSIINQLLEVGADSTIANRSGLSPQDFGVGGQPGQQGSRDESRSKNQPGEIKESSSDIIGSITQLLQQTEAEFTAELNSKKQAIDKIHQQLRDTSAQLGEQRRKYEVELAESKIRDTRKLKISNLTPAINEERAKLERLQQNLGSQIGNIDGPMQLGDADQGLSISENLQATQILSSIDLNVQPLDPNSQALLDATLPSASVLRARLAAYQGNNAGLEEGVKALQSKSSELAAKYRVIIGLCTQTEENKVDSVLSSLLRAVESERGVELNRVRDFLVRVGEDS